METLCLLMEKHLQECDLHPIAKDVPPKMSYLEWHKKTCEYCNPELESEN